eukprot:COSAG01_NODE_459_length_16728_cov_50.324794_8_plen_117_part_00
MIAEHMAAGQSSSESPEEASDGSPPCASRSVREQVVALLEESGFQRYNQVRVRVRGCWFVCSMCVVQPLTTPECPPTPSSRLLASGWPAPASATAAADDDDDKEVEEEGGGGCVMA